MFVYYMCICMYVCMCMCILKYVYMRVHMCMCICVCVCVYVYGYVCTLIVFYHLTDDQTEVENHMAKNLKAFNRDGHRHPPGVVKCRIKAQRFGSSYLYVFFFLYIICIYDYI